MLFTTLYSFFVYIELVYSFRQINDIKQDAFLETPQIAVRHGYAGESHILETPDGYLLTVHRIQNKSKVVKQNGQAIYLQHGLLGDSSTFVTNSKTSLAFFLCDVGYDVWLGNFRGNGYSKYHVNLTESDATFWDFSWDQMASFDVPKTIDYIQQYTDRRIIYIGHSMGSTTGFAALATLPNYNDKIRAFFALAPIAFLRNVKSPIRMFSPFANDLDFIAKFLGANQFLPNSKIIKFLANYGCNILTTIQKICNNIVFVLFGFDKDQVPAELLPIILNHAPAGTSTRTVLHYSQEIRDSQFQHYDFGRAENLRRYGADRPPLYNVRNVNVPVYLYYSTGDWLAVEKDVQYLYSELPNPKKLYKVPLDAFNHLDFLWAKDADRLLYQQLLLDIQSLDVALKN